MANASTRGTNNTHKRQTEEKSQGQTRGNYTVSDIQFNNNYTSFGVSLHQSDIAGLLCAVFSFILSFIYIDCGF